MPAALMWFSIDSKAARAKLTAICVGALGLLLCAPFRVLAAESSATIAASSDTRNAQESLLSVAINGRPVNDTALVVRLADGRSLIPHENLLRWRFVMPANGRLSIDGVDYYPLESLVGLKYRVDESQQLLLIDAPANLFTGTRLAGPRGEMTVPTRSPLGGFLNYDVFVDRETSTSSNALAEAGLFNLWGVGVSSFLRRDLPEGPRQVRLTTNWTHDRPTQMTSFRMGDLINVSGSWGRSVRFGGIQWGTNFASQPGFIGFPRPALSGEAILPSTIDLFVNDALRMRRQVQAGPFTVEDLPVLTGQGEARLVVTDVLGRQQIILAPYYASPRLLEKGLNAYSYEVGKIRENFGIESNEYGRPLAVATFRRGFSGIFTGETHAELLEDQQTLGLGGVLLWPKAGVFSASVAASQRDTGSPSNDADDGERETGGQVTFAFQRQGRATGFGLNAQLNSSRFAQVGLDPGRPPPRMTGQAFMSVSLGGSGSLGLSYTLQERRDAEKIELLNASYGLTIPRIGFLSLTALHVMGHDANTSFRLNFTRMLGNRHTGSVNASHDEDGVQASVRMQRGLPAGDGFGYRMVAGLADSDQREMSVSMQNRVGTYIAEIGQTEGETRYRGTVSGGLAWLGTDAFLSRRIDSSFAVVQVPGYADVDVYRENQLIARTNKDGTALVTRLRPYEVNSLRIEQSDLPMDTHIGSLQLEAIPYLRSGLRLSFPIKRSLGATFSVVLDSGDPIPSGALAKIEGTTEEFPVGLRGEVYVTGLDRTNRIRMTWHNQTCHLDVIFPESSDPLPDLGSFTCHGVTP